jgi:hypothetical protein
MENGTLCPGSNDSTCYSSQRPRPAGPVRPAHATSALYARREHAHHARVWARQLGGVSGGGSTVDGWSPDLALHELQGMTYAPLHRNLRKTHGRGELHGKATAYWRWCNVHGGRSGSNGRRWFRIVLQHKEHPLEVRGKKIPKKNGETHATRHSLASELGGNEMASRGRCHRYRAPNPTQGGAPRCDGPMTRRRWPELRCQQRSLADLKAVAQLNFGGFRRKKTVAKGEMALATTLL